MTDVQLKSFVDAARNLRSDSRIALNKDKTGVTGGSGRIVRWVGNFRSASNRQATNAFAASLRARYGDELAGLALESAGIDGAAKRGRPLRAMQVRSVVQQAEQLEASFRQRNAVVASHMGQTRFGNILGRQLLAGKVAKAARESMPHGAFVAQRLDLASLSEKVNSAIMAAGREGMHLVSTQEAAEIQESVIAKELEATHLNLARAAEGKLDFNDPSSMARKLFNEIVAATEGAEGLGFDRLSLEARELLTERLARKVIDPFNAPRREELGLLRDDSALESAVRPVLQDFVAERAESKRLVASLPISNPTKLAMADLVLHDAVEPRLAYEFGKAFSDVEGPLRTLGEPQEITQRRQSLGKICNAMDRAVEASGSNIGDANARTDAYSAFWRTSLALCGAEQVTAIAESMRPNQDLSEIHAGIKHFQDNLAMDIVSDDGRLRPFKDTLYTMESFVQAAKYESLLDTLMLELGRQSKVDLKVPRPNGEISDAAIAAMRDLGIPMPAPQRLGSVEPDVPLSEPTLREIHAGIERHKAEADRARTNRGFFPTAIVDFNRADYFIDGQLQPKDQQSAMDSFRRLCTKQDGALNEKMLQRVSAFANQAGLGIAYSVFFGSDLRPDLAAMDGTPSSALEFNKTLSYDLAPEKPDGDLLLRIRYAMKPDTLALMDDKREIQPTALDSNRSELKIEMDMRFDAETCEPKLERVKFGYALLPPEGEQPEVVPGSN